MNLCQDCEKLTRCDCCGKPIPAKPAPLPGPKDLKASDLVMLAFLSPSQKAVEMYLKGLKEIVETSGDNLVSILRQVETRNDNN